MLKMFQLSLCERGIEQSKRLNKKKRGDVSKKERTLNQRTLTVGGRITVQLVSCFTRLD